MKILGLDHVSVTTADIARSLAFYRDLLGIPVRGVGELSGDEVERITGDGRRADADRRSRLGRGQVLELIEYVDAGEGAALPLDRPGSGHIGLTVDDVDEIHRDARRRGGDGEVGARRLTEPGDWFGARCMTVLDPDGVAVELVERPSIRPRRSHGAGSRATPEGERQSPLPFGHVRACRLRSCVSPRIPGRRTMDQIGITLVALAVGVAVGA